MTQDDTNDTEPTSGFRPLSTTDEQQWQQASSDVELGLILILLGLVFAISGAANYLVAKLDKMSG